MDLTTKVLGFRRLGPRRSYSAVQGHPAEAYVLDVASMRANTPVLYRDLLGEPLPDDVLTAPRRSPSHSRYFGARSTHADLETIEELLQFVVSEDNLGIWAEGHGEGTDQEVGRRMWLLAVKAMLADSGKLLVSLLGVVFSVVLVNLQGGLLLGMLQKADLLVDYGHTDIWVGHRHMNNVDIGTFIPDRWVHRIRASARWSRPSPTSSCSARRRCPTGGSRTSSWWVATRPACWATPGSWPTATPVRDPDGILVDIYDATRPGGCRVGDVREINGHRPGSWR